ncbi:cupin domain-containing protein [Glaciecola sp. MH2013]|uniref:cupin domain-containing protein n=1 Tax=Glaciecola sp. MH2013 TaxID=2785524 RepID=UPI00189E0243|nr:cupin domain-containing protein [Glaciecola sp. MH2013]MBF7073359.1 cupin domain-containing protein [Glaciecola sp. MH2013]
MEIRANFDEAVLVHSDELDWVESPMAGVDRRPLDRVGAEVARATSIVRYAAGSHFSAHVHTGGEEFIVLSGVFQDEHGDFPAGSYIRNPPQSKHTPGSDEGCVIFVKLWQFQLDDRTHVRKKISELTYRPAPYLVNQEAELGAIDATNLVSEALLHADEFENVKLLQVKPNTPIRVDDPGGIELLVLDGELLALEQTMRKHSWLRLPTGMVLNAVASNKGASIWMKTGNLSDVNKQIERVKKA